MMVILMKNPLHSVLSLVSSFIFASLSIFISGNEFFALFFLIIYLGAIAILFLFVVMMLNIKYQELQTSRLYFPIGIVIGSVFLFETQSVFSVVLTEKSNLMNKSHNLHLNWYMSLDTLNDIALVGEVFYAQYLIQILIAGLVLYTAVIGVAFLTVSLSFNKVLKEQRIFKQVSRKNIL